MSRCKSCDCVLNRFEMGLKVTLPDNTTYQEDFCSSCLTQYVFRVDELDVSEHQYQHLTDPKYKYFKVFEE